MPKVKDPEPWNEGVLTWDEPQIWVLVSPVEAKAMMEGVVPTKFKERLKILDREILHVGGDNGGVQAVHEKPSR
jgi:hypothetical protein